MSYRRALLAFVLACVPVRLHAQATGSEIPVNTTTPDSQSAPRAAMDGSGRFVVVWQSAAQDGSGLGVYARRFSIAGAPQGGETEVNTTTSGDQKLPAVSTDDAGNFVVVWEGEDADGRGIFARIFLASGAPLTGEIAVNATTAGDQTRPAVSMRASGEFVVVWEGADAEGTGVYAQRFDAAGVAQGTELALNSLTANAQTRPVVAVDATGRFTAAWESDLHDGSGLGVYARRFEANGTPRDAADFRVNTTVTGHQQLPALGAANNGDFVVAWQSAQASDSDGGVYAQRYQQNGLAQGSEFRVNTASSGLQHHAALGMDANGNFVVAWSGPDAASDGIFGQRYRADGVALGPEFAANTTTGGTQGEPALAMNRKLQPLVDSRVLALAWTSPDAALQGITARLGGLGNSVTVLAPDDGRAWSVGSSQRIRFAHTLPFATRNFKIELIVNGGAPQTLQAAYVAGRTVGNYQHAPVADPGFPGGPFTGVIRVTSTVDATATDESVPFPIEQPQITVLQPPPDPLRDVPGIVKWGHNLGLQSLVKVELARDGTSFDETLSPPAHVANAWAHEGQMPWTPTGACTSTGSCRIKVTSIDIPAVSGVSAPFDINTVIFVDNTAAPGGNGSMAQPYHTLAAAEAASQPGGIIFVYAGSGTPGGYDAGITLKDGQRLIGEGTGLVLNGQTLVAPGSRPKLARLEGAVITLAQDNEVAGLTVQPPGTVGGIRGSGILGSGALGSANVHDVTLSLSDSDGIVLDTTPTGTLTLTDNTITGMAASDGGGLFVTGGSANVTGSGNSVTVTDGRLLSVRDTTGGSIQLTGGPLASANASAGAAFFDNNTGSSVYLLENVAISGASSFGVALTDNPSAAFTFKDLDVTTAAGTAVSATNVGLLAIDPGTTGSNLVATGGAGLELFQVSLSAFLHTLSSTNAAGIGLALNTVSGQLVAEDGAISGPASTGVAIFSSTASVDYPGNITKTAAGRLVSIGSRPPGSGTITFSGDLDCHTACTGIELNANAGGSVTFSGASKILNTGAQTGVLLTSNAGSRINFIGGGLAITTTSGAAFTASGGATALNVTGGSNSISTTTGAGVSISNTTIGVGVTFNSVSVNGAATGINVDNAGGGPFLANGGSLQNVTTRGVDVNAGSGSVTYAGSISTSGISARSVEVTSRTGGTVTLSGNITDTAAGILVQNNQSGSPTVTFSGASKTISPAPGSNAVNLSANSTATINFTGGGLALTTTTGTGFSAVSGAAAVNVTGSGNTISTTTGTAVSLNGITIGGSGITFDSVSVNGAGLGISVTNASGGAFAANGGALQNVTNRGVDVDLGNANITYAGSITTSGASARSVEITGRTGGAVTLSGNITDTGIGILAQNNSSGSPTLTFSGAQKTITPSGTNSAVQLLSNATATISFTNGQLALTTTTGTAFNVTGGAAGVNVTGSGNTVVTTTGTAVNVNGSTIGASGISFDSVSVAGAGTAIALANAGAGAFAANGGALQNVTSRGVDVSGGSGDVTYAGSITTAGASARSVEIESHTGGVVTLSGNITDTGIGILVQNNNSGSPVITFSGAQKTITPSGSNSAVVLANNATATIGFTGGGLALTTTTGTAFNVTGGAAGVNVTGSGNTIATTTGTAVNVNGTTIGTSGITFDSASVSGAGSGILIASAGAGAFAANGGALQNVTSRGVDVDAGSGNVTYAGSITTSGTGARSAEITNRTGGTVTLSGSITDTGAGILVQNNQSGSPVITFSGTAKTISPTVAPASANPALRLETNPTATINFENGGLDIDTTDRTALIVTGGGTVNVNGSGNTIDTTTATAVVLNGDTLNVGSSLAVNTTSGIGLNVTGGTSAIGGSGLSVTTVTGTALSGTSGGTLSVTGAGHTLATTAGIGVNLSGFTIGGDGVNFASVSVNGAGNGIVLTNLTGGAFAANGGTLQDVTIRGVDVDGGNADVTYAGSITTSGTNARSVEITNRTGGTTTLSGAITDTGSGILVQNNQSGSPVITFSGASKTLNPTVTPANVNPALRLETNPTATINFENGGLDIDTTDRTALNATGGGTVNVNGSGNTIDTTTGTGIVLSGNTLNVGSSLAVKTTSGAGINYSGTSAIGGSGLAVTTTSGTGFLSSVVTPPGGTLSVTGTGHTITTASGTAVNLSGFTIGPDGVNLASVSVNGAASGIVLANLNGGPFVANGGTLQGVTSRGVDVTGGNSSLTYAGSIVTGNPNARSVEIESRTGGSVTLSGDITDTGTGILVQNNSSGSPVITFSGAQKTITPSGGNSAVQLLGNATATINFTNGQLALTTTSGAAFTATNGAAGVNVTGAGNTIATATGIGVNISGSTIGADGITFDSVSTNGATGIAVANAGGGAFAANGGSLQNATNRGVSLNGGTGNFSYSGSISTAGTAARAVDVQNRAGGVATFSGNITEGGLGILVQNNSAGSPTVTFSGASKTIAPSGSNSGVSLVNNATATINFAGGGLDIDTTTGIGLAATGGGTVNLSGSGNTINTTTGAGISLAGDTLNLADGLPVTVSGTGIGVNVSGTGTSAIAGSGLAVSTTSGGGLTVSGGGTFSLTGTGHTVTTTTGTGVNIANTTIGAAGVTLASVSVSGAGSGISLDNAGGGPFTVNGGSLANVVTRGLDLNLGSGDVSYAGTITTSGTSARSVEITNRTGGAVTLSGAITDTAAGISITGNTSPGASVLFSGGLLLNTGVNTAFTATGNAGGVSIAATQNNTSIVNTISNTGMALNVANTTIGASGLSFRSISSSGGTTNGIILDHTGTSGGLTVTGNGAAGTGGTISGKNGSDSLTTQGIGIYLDSTANVSLAWMQLNNFQNYAIRGLNVDGFTLADSVINHSTGTNGTSSVLEEGSVSFGVRGGATGLTGTASITNSTIDDGFRDGFSVFNASGTLDLTLANASLSGSGNDGVSIQTTDTATVNVVVKNSQFAANAGEHFDANAENASNLHVSFGDGGANTLAGGGPGSARQNVSIQTGVAWSGIGSANVSNNSINNAGDTPINLNIGGPGTFTAVVDGNTIGTSGVAGSGTVSGRDAIRVVASGDKLFEALPDGGSLTVAVTNNTLQQVSGSGIVVIGRDGGTAADPIELNVTVTGNLLREPASGQRAILVQSGESNSPTPDEVRLHADIGGAGAAANVVQGNWGGVLEELRVQHGFSATSEFILAGLGADTSDTAAVASYLAGRNTLNGGAASATLLGGGVYAAGGAPPQP